MWDNLHRAGVVGDPLYRNNDQVYSNQTTAAYDFTTVKQWIFTKTFDCPPAITTPAAGSVLLLEMDGIQTVATVTLNGQPVLTVCFSVFSLHIFTRVCIIPHGICTP